MYTAKRACQLALLLAAGLASAAPAHAADASGGAAGAGVCRDDPGLTLPAAEWTRADRAAAGWSADELEAAKRYARSIGSLSWLLIENGRIVDSFGPIDRVNSLHSARKSLMSAMYGQAIAAGLIDPRKTLAELGIDDTAPRLTAAEKQATVRDLLMARSGVYHVALGESPAMAAARPERGSHAHGTFWYYNNWDFNALGTIFNAATKTSLFDFFHQRIAQPLHMEDFQPAKQAYFDGPESVHRYYNFEMSARDMARFGLLFLNHGCWKGREIVPAAWVRESTAPYSDTVGKFQPKGLGYYGYMWWVAHHGNFIPNAGLPDGSYAALGVGIQAIVVVPRRNLVFVHRVATDDVAEPHETPIDQLGTLIAMVLRAKHVVPAAPAALAASVAPIVPAALTAAMAPAAAVPAAAAAALDCDLLFAGGRVVDGTGAPWFRADVCIAGDRIAAVGQLAGAHARRRIDATRLVVTPGFIDMLGQSEYNVLVDNRAASKITQGITSEITGEGTSIAPVNQRMIDEGKEVWEHYGVKPTWTTLREYWQAFEKARPAINLGTFVGAGGVRNLVIGESERAATPAELEQMERVVAQAMEDGALGVSTSLQYVPDRFASTEEIIALARVAAQYGGSYITHQRSESYAIDASLDEVFRIAREAGLPAQIFHLKTACPGNWGRMGAVLRRLEEARAQGLDVSANQYPWTAGANGLDATLPVWARDGGTDKMIERLRDPAVRARVRDEMHRDDHTWENQYQCTGGGKGLLVTYIVNPAFKRYEGRTIAEIARDEHKDEADAIMDLIIATHNGVANINFMMDERDVRTALRHPLVSLGTDAPGQGVDGILGQDRTHPRAFGSATRILGFYVRDEKLLPLEEAVRKMTSLPASRMGLAGRGILRPGMFADVVAFDPEAVREVATYADPVRYSVGIPYVAVNGELVVDEGKITSARPGRPLHGPGYRP